MLSVSETFSLALLTVVEYRNKEEWLKNWCTWNVTRWFYGSCSPFFFNDKDSSISCWPPKQPFSCIFTFKYCASEMCPKLFLFKCLLDLGYVNPSVVFKGEIHREKISWTGIILLIWLFVRDGYVYKRLTLWLKVSGTGNSHSFTAESLELFRKLQM